MMLGFFKWVIWENHRKQLETYNKGITNAPKLLIFMVETVQIRDYWYNKQVFTDRVNICKECELCKSTMGVIRV